MDEQLSNKPTTQLNSKRRWIFAGIGGAIVAGILTMNAFGNEAGHSRHGHHRHGMWAEMSPEQAGKRIDKMVNRMLDKADATTEQKQRVAQIAKDAAKELMPLRKQHKEARQRAVDLLSQPTIDRAAIEQIRTEELQLGDAVSKRITQAIADAAEALTPEQRAKLAAHWKKRHG